MNASYTFRFYRTITNPDGKRFDSTVEIIKVLRAKSPDRAWQAAVRRFTRHHKLTSWDCLASGCEQQDEIARVS